MNQLPPAHTRGATIIQVAMDLEAAPFLTLTDQAAPDFDLGQGRFSPRWLGEGRERLPLLLVRSQIGLVNAASALASALALVPSPAAVFSAGTAGGLHTDIEVGDLVVGTDFTYTDADATAFGYEYGQVPGMPARYSADPALVDKARTLAKTYTGDGRVQFGTMLAGGSFVTAHNVKDTRSVFPSALSTDMETTALAQVSSTRQLSFLSVRGVSDLCGPAAGQDFHMDAPIVAERSARFITALLTNSE